MDNTPQIQKDNFYVHDPYSLFVPIPKNSRTESSYGGSAPPSPPPTPFNASFSQPPPCVLEIPATSFTHDPYGGQVQGKQQNDEVITNVDESSKNPSPALTPFNGSLGLSVSNLPNLTQNLDNLNTAYNNKNYSPIHVYDIEGSRRTPSPTPFPQSSSLEAQSSLNSQSNPLFPTMSSIASIGYDESYNVTPANSRLLNPNSAKVSPSPTYIDPVQSTAQPMQPLQPLSIDGLSESATPSPNCPSPSSSTSGGSTLSGGLSSYQPPHLKNKRNILVEYKHGRKGVCTLPDGVISSSVETDPEACIIVEGDRGIDICRILSLTVRKSADAPGLKHPKVLREASKDEIEYWETALVKQEVSAVGVVNKLIKEANLPLTVTHASYQLDKKKLNFIYESPHHQPDFRCLLSKCYPIWRCRIWFTCLPRKVAEGQ